MTDPLDDALRQLQRTDITPPPLATVQRGARRRRNRRRAAGLATASAVVLLLAAGAVAAPSQPDSLNVTGGPSSTTSTTTPRTTTTLSATPPPGYQSVVGPGGQTVGYLSLAALDQAIDAGEPILDIGTGKYQIRGFPVVDADRKLVGYFLTGDAGFVTLEAVANPADADELGRQQADDQLTQDEARQLLEELKAKPDD